MTNPISWQQIAVVALGGGFGSAARFWISTAAANYAQESRFPLGTFMVNIAGCLFVGVLWAANEHWPFLTTYSRLLLFTGVAGGFTTFSAFGLETILLLRRGDVAMASLYVSLSLICGLSIMALSIWLLRPSPQ
jgi:CrcB protein